MNAVSQTSAGTRVERPASLRGLSELVKDSAGSVLVRGAGTKQQWGGRVRDPDLVVDTTAMSGVLTYNPADLTASVLAGTPLRDLQEHVAEHGQWLALDPPSAEHGATVGGLVATGDSGPARLRYGGPRDLVIGTTVVLADGTVARSGGHVIKNVAGYDLAKVLNGSLGSLAILAEVVVRLHPRPVTTATTAAPTDARTARALTLALMAGPLEPTAMEWLSNAESGEGELLVRMDGASGPVAQASERLVAVLAEHGVTGTTLATDEADHAWRGHRYAVTAAGDDTVVRVCGLPSELDELTEVLDRLTRATDVTATTCSQSGLGLHTVLLRGGTAADHADVLAGVREHAGRLGSSVLLRERSDALDPLVDALGPPPATTPLLRRLKDQFDPDARLAPGRFAGWY